MDGILTNIVYSVFEALKVLLIKICKIQSLDLLFLVVFIRFHISRYLSSQVFGTSFNIIWKKHFRRKFSFFNRFTQAPHAHPLNSQNPLSVTKVFCQCSLTYHGFSRLLCCDNARKNCNSRAELILQSNFNPRVVVFIKALGLRLDKNVIYGRKNFIGATWCSIDTCKWLEYPL